MIKIDELLKIFEDRLSLKSRQIQVYISDGEMTSSPGKLNHGFKLNNRVNLIICETEIELETFTYLIGQFFNKHHPNRPPVVRYAVDQLNHAQCDFHFMIDVEEIYYVKDDGQNLTISSANIPDLYDILERDNNVNYGYADRPPEPEV